jgi:amino acid transporter
LFGTFTGVFTPTLLTILGVIMYVRLGWVVGNAGFGGALLILFLALGITICTGLALSSIATNTRIGPGGPYAIITKSLGFEVGGSVGIPLYLSRPLGVAMYVFGFREGWLWIFPGHSALLVDLLVFSLLFAIAYASANLAFRVQYLVMAVIVASLVSIAASPLTFDPAVSVTWLGDYPGFPETDFQGTSFWQVFAVFFPATTGILAGANMSGELKDPRRAIPWGTLSAIGLSSVIYVVLAAWVARAGPMDELASNYLFIIENALFPPVVLAGLLGATFSLALVGFVGGPRILMAMGRHRIVPFADFVGETSPDGEPRNAMLVTGVLTLFAIMVRDLNTIAPLVTMFFLITYAVINVVVLVEGSLGLASFRPTLRVHKLVPLLGLVGCVFAMFIVNPSFALIAGAMVMMIYMAIHRQGVRSSGEDVRSSVLVALAEWAAAQVTEKQVGNPRAWKPNLLVPVEDSERLQGEFHFLLDVTRPEGTLKVLGLASEEPVEEMRPRIERLGRAFQSRDVLCTWATIASGEFTGSVLTSLQALQSAFFRPNMLFLTVPELENRHHEFLHFIVQARQAGVGVLLLALHPKAGLGQRQSVNLWVRRAPDSWDAHAAFRSGNLNLNLLTGYRLLRNWGSDVNLLIVISDESERQDAVMFLRELCDLARLPMEVTCRVVVGPFEEALMQAPPADLQILGLQPKPDFVFVNRMVAISRGSCLFVLDSGRESALV